MINSVHFSMGCVFASKRIQSSVFTPSITESNYTSKKNLALCLKTTSSRWSMVALQSTVRNLVLFSVLLSFFFATLLYRSPRVEYISNPNEERPGLIGVSGFIRGGAVCPQSAQSMQNWMLRGDCFTEMRVTSKAQRRS